MFGLEPPAWWLSLSCVQCILGSVLCRARPEGDMRTFQRGQGFPWLCEWTEPSILHTYTTLHVGAHQRGLMMLLFCLVGVKVLLPPGFVSVHQSITLAHNTAILEQYKDRGLFLDCTTPGLWGRKGEGQCPLPPSVHWRFDGWLFFHESVQMLRGWK